MNWIWENYSPKNKFVINQKIDPYSEVLSDVSDDFKYYINILIRFGQIFSVFDGKENTEELSEKNSGLFNIALHYLAHLDMLNGLDLNEFLCCILRSEIKNNIYGTEIKNLFFSDCVTEKERKIILKYFLEYRFSCENEELFSRIFLELFSIDDLTKYNVKFEFNKPLKSAEDGLIAGFVKPSPEIYYNSQKNLYYYYCGNSKNKAKFRLIRLMFSEVTDNIIDIWGKCFGVIGENNKFSASYPEAGNFVVL